MWRCKPASEGGLGERWGSRGGAGRFPSPGGAKGHNSRRWRGRQRRGGAATDGDEACNRGGKGVRRAAAGCGGATVDGAGGVDEEGMVGQGVGALS